MQKTSEFAALIGLVAELRPERIVEIGTARGGTLWAWCQVAAPTATVVSVDMPGGDYGGGNDDSSAFLRYARAAQRLEFVAGDSHDLTTQEQARELLDGPVDFLFIDGDHTYAGARADFETYGALVRPGGLIALHDIVEHRPELNCGVHLLWRELVERHSHVELVDAADDRGWGPWGGIGVIRVAQL